MGSLLLVVVGVAVAYLYRRNKTLEKYAVPILDEHEQIEPTMGGNYSDSDEEHFRERKKVIGSGIGRSPKEMVSMGMHKVGEKMKKEKGKTKGRGKNQYHAQTYSDESDDDSDEMGGPSA